MIVSSCDAYSDLWPFFFHFFEQRWPQAPRPLYLVANFQTFDHAGVRTLAVGPDRSWGATIHAALEKIPDEFVIFLLDDFFLDQTIPMGWVEDLVAQLDQARGDFVSLYHVAVGGAPLAEGSMLSEIRERMECPGFHAGIFRRSYLMKLAAAGENIWRTESLMRDDALDRRFKQFSLTAASPFHLTYVESVRGRFWKKNGLDYLKQNGLKPDLWRRPHPPSGDDVISKVIRSFHKRRMQWMERLRSKAHTKPVQPLKSDTHA
ncbi:MAG: hypothetical protein ACKVY0_05800 [Prosthecobacter sp.]